MFKAVTGGGLAGERQIFHQPDRLDHLRILPHMATGPIDAYEHADGLHAWIDPSLARTINECVDGQERHKQS